MNGVALVNGYDLHISVTGAGTHHKLSSKRTVAVLHSGSLYSPYRIYEVVKSGPSADQIEVRPFNACQIYNKNVVTKFTLSWTYSVALMSPEIKVGLLNTVFNLMLRILFLSPSGSDKELIAQALKNESMFSRRDSVAVTKTVGYSPLASAALGRG